MSDINLKAPIEDLAGKAVPDVTVGSIAINALLMPYPDEQNLSGDEKVKRFKLAQRLHEHPMIALAAEDIALIKRLVAKAYPPMVVGRVWGAFDPASV